MPKTQRTNTPAEQNKENQDLILYRLGLVEEAVKELASKFDKLDTLKPKDLDNFKDAIIEKVTGINDHLQKQLDEKAEKSELADLKKLVYAAFSFVSVILGGYILWAITKG